MGVKTKSQKVKAGFQVEAACVAIKGLNVNSGKLKLSRFFENILGILSSIQFIC